MRNAKEAIAILLSWGGEALGGSGLTPPHSIGGNYAQFSGLWGGETMPDLRFYGGKLCDFCSLCREYYGHILASLWENIWVFPITPPLPESRCRSYSFISDLP